MNLSTTFIAMEKPEMVFSAFHRYKLRRNLSSFFPSLFVKWRFFVLSENTLGIGATYDWKIWLLGFPVLQFQEQVVEWQDGKSVANYATQGWEMDFRIDLEAAENGICVDVVTDLSLPGPDFLNRFLLPAYEWGLQIVCRKGLSNEGIRTSKALNDGNVNSQKRGSAP